MKRTTIFIPEGLEADLQSYARRTKKPAAWVVREAIATFLESHATPTALPASLGMGHSGRSDLSERFEELLFADLSLAENEPPKRQAPRTPKKPRRPAK